jgi:putative membrane protein
VSQSGIAKQTFRPKEFDMRSVFLSSVLLPALIVLTLSPAVAQTGEQSPLLSLGNPGFAAPGANAPGQSASPQRNQADHVFLIQAAIGGLAEVQLAQLADQKSQNDGVRDFAEGMIRDHSQANEALSHLVQNGDAQPQLDAENRQVYGSLDTLTGPAFDIEYLRTQVQNHQRMALLAQYVIGSGADPGMRQFATDVLPNIFMHLVAARELLERVSAENPQIAAAPPRTVSGMPTPQTPRPLSN